MQTLFELLSDQLGRPPRVGPQNVPQPAEATKRPLYGEEGVLVIRMGAL
jgi:hypothetical protein